MAGEHQVRGFILRFRKVMYSGLPIKTHHVTALIHVKLIPLPHPTMIRAEITQPAI